MQSLLSIIATSALLLITNSFSLNSLLCLCSFPFSSTSRQIDSPSSVCRHQNHNIEEIDKSNFHLPPLYEHFGGPWRTNNHTKLFRSRTIDDNFSLFFSYRIQGLNTTVESLLRLLRSKGCLPFVWGGAVRDALLGIPPNDIDLSLTCHPGRQKAVCIQNFGPENCQRPHHGSGKLRIGLLLPKSNNNQWEREKEKGETLYNYRKDNEEPRIAIDYEHNHQPQNKLNGGDPFKSLAWNIDLQKRSHWTEPVDVAHWNNSFEVNGSLLTYTVNSLAYYPAIQLSHDEQFGSVEDQNELEPRAVIIDLTGRGVQDSCTRRIVIPTRELYWEEWAEEAAPYKLLRFWVLRARGFTSDRQTQRFLSAKTRVVLTKGSYLRFFCHKLLEGDYLDDRKCLYDKKKWANHYKEIHRFRRLLQQDLGSALWERLGLDDDRKL